MNCYIAYVLATSPKPNERFIYLWKAQFSGMIFLKRMQGKIHKINNVLKDVNNFPVIRLCPDSVAVYHPALSRAIIEIARRTAETRVRIPVRASSSENTHINGPVAQLGFRAPAF